MIAALATHLWESTLFALAAGAATPLFRNNGAHVRYWLWFAASLKFLIPFSALAAFGRAIGPNIAEIPASQPVIAMLRTISAPDAVPAAVDLPARAAAFDPTPLFVALWAAGFVAVVAVWTLRWLRIRAALRITTPVAIDAPIPVRMTATRIEPGLVGILRPVLLLSEGIATDLTPDELRAVLDHELCHLSRRDNLTAAIHMLTQAIFWFHPLLWWIGTRLVAEREQACDEAVVASGSAPAIYAEGILKVCKLHVRSPLMCASGVAGANLRQRIERIIADNRAQALGLLKSSALAVTAVMLLAGPLLLGWATAHARIVPAPPVRPARRLVPTTIPAPTAAAAPAAEVAPPPAAPPATTAALPAPPVPVVVASIAPTLPQLKLPTACLVDSYENGDADLTLTVGVDGSVTGVTVDRSSGKPALDQAMRIALAKSRAVAGTVDGVPRAMPISVRMEANDAPMRGGPGGNQMVVTITRGAEPRTGQYSCYGHDEHPFNPRDFKL